VLARRVRTFAATIEDLALRDVTARLARFLLTEAHREGDVVDLAETREEVAFRLAPCANWCRARSPSFRRPVSSSSTADACG
jgi:hypothetical protein